MENSNIKSQQSKQNSSVVAIWGILLLCYSIWLLIAHLLILPIAPLLIKILSNNFVIILTRIMAPTLSLSIPIGVIYLISSIAILKFKTWGRILAVITASVTTFLFLVLLLLAPLTALSLLPSLLFLIVFVHPNIKRMFGNYTRIGTKRENKVIDRPIIVTLVCVMVFMWFALVCYNLLSPKYRSGWIEAHGILYTSIYALSAILALIGIIGYWKMQRWGIYIYLLSNILDRLARFLLHVNVDYGLLASFQYLPMLIIIITGIIFYKKMK